MNTIIELSMNVLRNKNSTMAEFRAASEHLACALAHQVSQFVQLTKTTVTTPLGESATTHVLANNIVLIPILRSGLALLPTFLHFFPSAKVGFFGMKRDEQTAKAHLYYQKLPPIEADDQIIILDPMLATGGSTADALTILTKQGIAQERIIFAGIICAPEGLNKIRTEFPKVRLILAVQDNSLNAQKYIVPGLGDFGDRYFGTPQ